MTEGWVLVLWLVTAAGGITLLFRLLGPERGTRPTRFGIPSPLVIAHATIALSGGVAWLALVIAAEPGGLLVPAALAAVAAAALGVVIFWWAGPRSSDPDRDADDPSAERPPMALRYGHGLLGLATAASALFVALR